MRLAFDSYLDAIGEEAARIADLDLRPDAAVPGLSQWRAADVVEHVLAQLATWGAAVGGVEQTAAAPDLEEAAGHLVAALAGAGEEARVANWTAREETAGFVARHVALDLALHRADLEGTFGAPRPIETELAVDGIEERLDVHLGRGAPLGVARLGGSLALVCRDDPAAFLVEVSRGRLSYRQRRGPADAVVVGPASSLFRFAWGRVDGRELELSGSGEVAAAFGDLPGESR